jgi:glycosyltransferase involved in cell wall biosynthesis
VSPHAAAPAAGWGPSPSRRPRDIFLIANNIDELGGLQRVAHLLAELFAERGHRVRLIGIRPFTPAHSYPSRGAEYSTHVIGDAEPASHHRRSGARARVRTPTPQDVERLNRVFGEARDGIVICLQIHAMNWVAAADTSHLRVIGMSHESFAASLGITQATKGSRRFRQITSLYRDIDAFLLLTQADAEAFRRVGLNNTGVMPNPVTLRPTDTASLETPTIINVGRLTAQKNQKALVEAFALVATDHPGWTVKIFGDGELKESLAEQIETAGLTGRVLLMGATNDIEGELLDSSIFALSSDFEGLPLVLVEAMTCGVPCVAFDCSPGIREIITDNQDGLVVPNRSVTALAAGVRALIEDSELRRSMGRAALAGAQRYSEDHVLGLWEDLFDTVER